MLGSKFRPATRVAATRIVGRVLTWRSGALVISGLGCLAAAAWVLHIAAGLAATGVALLVLELCSRKDV